MSGPSPVVIDFVLKGLEEAKSALKSIADTVTKTEQKSVAAAKRGLTEQQKVDKAKVEGQAKALIRVGELEKAAGLAGTKFVQKQLDIRLKHMIEHSKAMFEAAQKEEKRIQGIRETSATMAGRLAEKSAKAQNAAKIKADNDAQRALNRSAKVQHDAAMNHFGVEIAAADKAAKNKLGIRERSATMAGTIAKKQASEESSVLRKLAVEEKKARLELLSGTGPTKQPSTSPQARIAMLSGAKGKSPEERAALLDKAVGLRQEGQAERQGRKKAEAEAKASEAEKTRNLEVEEKRRLSIRERSATMAGQFAKRQVAEEAAAKAKAERESTKTREAFAKTVYGSGSSAIKNATNIVGRTAAAVGRGFMNVGGGFSIEDSVQREVAFRGKAADIAASTNENVSQSTLMSSAREVAIAQGSDPTEVLSAYEQVKKLNDKALPQALRVMPAIGKIAAITGTDMGDMGMLAANITASHADKTYVDDKGVTRKGISDKALERQLRVFARQGIEGGVEISDFAKYGARITAGAGLFAGDLGNNEATLGMAAQVARQKGGAASAAEATLAAQRFGTDMQKKAGHLKELGIDVNANDGSGKMRNIEDVIVDMLGKESSVTGISEFKIGERGNRVLTGFADIYREAGGGEAGAKAVRATFAKGRKDITEAETEARFKKRLAETDKQLNIAMTKLRTEVGQKLVPSLIPLIDALSKATPVIGMLLTGLTALVNWAARNPFGGLGALVMGFFMKELAAAAISSTIKSFLAGAAPVGGGKGGGAGLGGAIVGTVGAAGVIGVNAALGFSSGAEGAQDISAKVDAWQRGDHQRGLSPEKAKEMVDQAQSRLSKTSALEQAANLATSPFVESSKKDYDQYKRDQGLTESKEGQALLKQLVDALQQNTTATKASTGAGSPPNTSSPGAPNRSVAIPQRSSQ